MNKVVEMDAESIQKVHRALITKNCKYTKTRETKNPNGTIRMAHLMKVEFLVSTYNAARKNKAR